MKNKAVIYDLKNKSIIKGVDINKLKGTIVYMSRENNEFMLNNVISILNTAHVKNINSFTIENAVGVGIYFTEDKELLNISTIERGYNLLVLKDDRSGICDVARMINTSKEFYTNNTMFDNLQYNRIWDLEHTLHISASRDIRSDISVPSISLFTYDVLSEIYFGLYKDSFFEINYGMTLYDRTRKVKLFKIINSSIKDSIMQCKGIVYARGRNVSLIKEMFHDIDERLDFIFEYHGLYMESANMYLEQKIETELVYDKTRKAHMEKIKQNKSNKTNIKGERYEKKSDIKKIRYNKKEVYKNERKNNDKNNRSIGFGTKKCRSAHR